MCIKFICYKKGVFHLITKEKLHLLILNYKHNSAQKKHTNNSRPFTEGSFGKNFINITPLPVLPGLKRFYYRMPGSVKMLRCMLVL